MDLQIFVAPAPGEGERLFERRARDRASDERSRAAALERLLREPAAMADLLEEIGGAPLADFARKNPRLLENVRSKLLAGRPETRRSPAPKPEKYWAIADRYRGIEHAQLVVVNLHSETERERADQLLADVTRLRTDKELFTDILGFRGSRVPITAVAANITAPHDRGRKKALARVRRTIRANSS